MFFRYKTKFISDIEQKNRKLLVNIAVAPFVGVWIEINQSTSQLSQIQSLPSWECGLKFNVAKGEVGYLESLPSWECGLKCL